MPTPIFPSNDAKDTASRFASFSVRPGDHLCKSSSSGTTTLALPSSICIVQERMPSNTGPPWLAINSAGNNAMATAVPASPGRRPRSLLYESSSSVHSSARFFSLLIGPMTDVMSGIAFTLQVTAPPNPPDAGRCSNSIVLAGLRTLTPSPYRAR